MEALYQAQLSERDFKQFQRLIYETAGITLSETKKTMVSGRLAKRLREHCLEGYDDYLRLLASGEAPGEVQAAVDLLTTNETYFFREPGHFDQLRMLAAEAARQGRREPFRVWSAASSSGEEAYSIAMVLADCCPRLPWEVFGSDISTRVLELAHSGHYPLARARNIPPDYLRRFCLRGIERQEGTVLVQRELRQRVRFAQVNLNGRLPNLGMFDVIFLRNVLIYFNGDTKRQVVARVLSQLRPGGHFFIGHSENLHGIGAAVASVKPSVYRKV